jgi:hypothetical protein
MFDNLREQANDTPFYEDESKFRQPGGGIAPPRKSSGSLLLGMTPNQRFIVAVMLLIAVCVLGSMCLLLTGRIGLM